MTTPSVCVSQITVYRASGVSKCTNGARNQPCLDGLRERLSAYRGMGARFAKWRAVIHISDALPSRPCISANAHALARYAALCQEQDLVPIVEPEALMDGSHSIECCEEVTGVVLHTVFDALFEQRVALECMLLSRVEDWRAGLGRCRATFPAPATSNAACGFPALRSPICFTSRFMGPTPGRLSACRVALDSR